MIMNQPIQGYRDLARHLRGLIDAGTHRPGEQLPTELDLSRQYAMNRHTIRAALQELELNGYLFRVRGRGTFVARRKIPYAIHPGTSFTGSLEKLGLHGTVTLHRAHVLPSESAVAAALDIPEGSEVVQLEILRLIEQIPACLTTSYLPAARFDGLADAAPGMVSLYALLRGRYGVKQINRTWSEIEAAMPDAHDRELLHMPLHMPVLLTRSLVLDESRSPIEFCVSRNRADAYTLRIDLNREEHM